ncbi:conjugal transfer protein TraF [Cellvibrio sp. QJXJ]|uniref:conjugal transfer protein TraF n=1 Tax=Cellvibrio sp. QJXJ TaxID=2964606 RepID=UPI0021C47679|nr:conjugal transfer protein TraF [Cellvibrio sp. QJXJ]UUA73686.1 conjugal transfer protein TraF [Cellvibrio sp. QJXJ]
MKKTLLSIALVSASLPSIAGEFHGSFSGMSGAAYATGNYSEGVLLNPSLGASYNPEKDDFALLFSVGALGSDKDDLIDQADELADLVTEIQATDSFTIGQAEDLKKRLQDIDGDTAQVALGANLVLSIPTELVSMAFIINSKGYISVNPDVADSDLGRIDSAIGGRFDPEDAEEGLQSTINGHGAIVTDIGVSFSKAFSLANGNHLLVGFKPKKVEVESIIYTSNVADFDEDDFDADKYTRKEDSMNYDLGLTYMAGKMRYGLVVNNLQDKTYKTIDPEETISIERQMTGAVGYVNGNFKAEVAADLNSVPAIGLGGEVQLMRVGLEYSAWDWLRLRAGIEQDSKNTLDDTYSFGVGVGALNLAYITGSEETEGAALSLGLRF